MPGLHTAPALSAFMTFFFQAIIYEKRGEQSCIKLYKLLLVVDNSAKKLGPNFFSKLEREQIFSKEKLGLKNNFVQKYWINIKFK